MSNERIVSIEAPDYKLIAEFRDLAKSVCEDREEVNLEFDEQDRLVLAVGQGLDESQDGRSYDMSTHEYFTESRGLTHDFRTDYRSNRSGHLEKIYEEQLEYTGEPPDPIDILEEELHTKQLLEASVDPVFVHSSVLMDAIEVRLRRKKYMNEPSGNKTTRMEINVLLERVSRARH